MAVRESNDWVVRAADLVLTAGEANGSASTCASGISPSGPVHLGNLREIMVPHFVADEIRRRGIDCRHILSWDDYDRLRKIPAGIPASFAEHIGRPLSVVPDPCGEHASWADHFKAPFRAALAELGVEVTEISQSEMYSSGAYREQVLHAMRERNAINSVLARYRTLPAAVDAARDKQPGAIASEDAYYPYKPYCDDCGRDTTTVDQFDESTTELQYHCLCGYRMSFRLAERNNGKLLWKVDWPMRWAFEQVSFESGGVDHSSPGSSFTVGSELVRDVFHARPPVYLGYSFVGTTGAAKMSGSIGRAPTPADALRIIEPPLLRWLYGRRRPNQSITIAFDQEISRLYDEWDALNRSVADGEADQVAVAVRNRAAATAVRTLPETPQVLPFRTLASIIDITAGDEEQIKRVLYEIAPGVVSTLDDVRPRLDRARAWVADHVAAKDRTQVRVEPDFEHLAALSETERNALKMLLDGLAEDWSVSGLTTLLYGISKIQRGLPLDTPATPELKAAQRSFFVLLYQLLVDRDTGPRLPTLLLSLGPERIRVLLAA